MSNCLGPVAEKLKQKRLIAIIGTMSAMILTEPHNWAIKRAKEEMEQEYDKLYKKGVSGF